MRRRVVLLLAAALCALQAVLLAPATSAAAPVVVSLTFDDGTADQLGYLTILQRLGLHGTFYVNTGAVGQQPRYLTREGVDRIAAAGDEIAGHTVLHADLPRIAPDEMARQICDDRATLASWGHPATSFAYPFGAYDPRVEAQARACGYTSARRVGGLGPVSRACPDCEASESIPAEDPFAVRTAGEADQGTTVASMQAAVAAAARKGRPSGGWVPFVFHRESCEDCGDLGTSPALLEQFGAWLVAEQRAGRVVVRTVGQVVGGTPSPAGAGPAPAARAFANPSLEATDPADPALPACWMRAGYGATTATYARTPGGHEGGTAETITVTQHRDGDAKILPRMDLGECTAPATPGGTYALSAWYRSTAPTQFAVYRRSGVGQWSFWAASPWFAPSAPWAQASWTPPPAPPDTTGLTAGLVITSVGSLSTDDYGVTATAPPPPTRGGWSVLALVAAVVVALGLLGALVGLFHHARTRRRGWRAYRPVPSPREPQEPTRTGERVP